MHARILISLPDSNMPHTLRTAALSHAIYTYQNTHAPTWYICTTIPLPRTCMQLHPRFTLSVRPSSPLLTPSSRVSQILTIYSTHGPHPHHSTYPAPCTQHCPAPSIPMEPLGASRTVYPSRTTMPSRIRGFRYGSTLGSPDALPRDSFPYIIGGSERWPCRMPGRPRMDLCGRN